MRFAEVGAFPNVPSPIVFPAYKDEVKSEFGFEDCSLLRLMPLVWILILLRTASRPDGSDRLFHFHCFGAISQIQQRQNESVLNLSNCAEAASTSRSTTVDATKSPA